MTADVTHMYRREVEETILNAWNLTSSDSYYLPGYCVSCHGLSAFQLDLQFAHASPSEHLAEPNWRERLACVTCGLNNRMRLAYSAANRFLSGSSNSFITEATTPFYRALRMRFPSLLGSEYLGEQYQSGETIGGILNMDVQSLAFSSNSLDTILSFDVLEHVPDVTAALHEFHRCLYPGGHLIWTAPFHAHAQQTEIRATLNQDKTVSHLMEPEYHGDPLNPEQGILSFRTFGWDLLSEMRSIGLDARFHAFWDVKNGNIGPIQFIGIARKEGSM